MAAETSDSRILALTGATGFVGSHVLRAALDAGWRVRALAREPARLPVHPALEPLKGRLEDDDVLSRLVTGADAVLHVAGLVAAARRADFHRINTEAAGRLAEMAARAGIRRFVHVSSLAAREPQLSPYAASKRASEDAVRNAFAGTDGSLAILRPPAVYGPGDRATLGLFDQLSRPLALLPGRSDMRVSLVHVRDLASALLHLAATEDADGEVLEVDDGTPEGYTWEEMARIAGNILGRPVKMILLPRALVRLAGHGADLISAVTGHAFMLSAAKTRELYHPDWTVRPPTLAERTDWTPRIRFAEGFRETLQWYCEQGWLPRSRLPEKRT